MRLITQYATEAVSRIFLQAFTKSKAEVLLMNICHPGEFTEDLFALNQPESTERLMSAKHSINGNWRRGP
ncbi:DNA polymerase V subunit UmuC, partial [Pseudomonas syringae pv. tagetis]